MLRTKCCDVTCRLLCSLKPHWIKLIKFYNIILSAKYKAKEKNSIYVDCFTFPSQRLFFLKINGLTPKD